MSIASRQERINTLLGEPENKCFQVFALVHERGYSEARFKKLVRQRQIDLNEGRRSGFFDPNFDPLALPHVGMVRKEKDGSYYFSDYSLQSVFMTLDRGLVQRFSEDNRALEQSGEAVHLVAQSYRDALQNAFPNIEFKTRTWARTKDLTVRFYFAIQPYNFDLHPPHDMDVLKPIRIVEGHTIHPA